MHQRVQAWESKRERVIGRERGGGGGNGAQAYGEDKHDFNSCIICNI